MVHISNEQRAEANEMVRDIEDHACKLRQAWFDTDGNVREMCETIREAAREMRRTLDKVERVVRHDLYNSL